MEVHVYEETDATRSKEIQKKQPLHMYLQGSNPTTTYGEYYLWRFKRQVGTVHVLKFTATLFHPRDVDIYTACANRGKSPGLDLPYLKVTNCLFRLEAAFFEFEFDFIWAANLIINIQSEYSNGG